MLPIPRPSARPLKIYATDPTQGYEAALKVSIPVEYEPLTPGPIGDRLEVVDYDAGAGAYYDAVDLEDPAILTQGGLDPSEADPRFHQQMVYAVASRTLSNFDRALGRRLRLARGKRKRLRLLPHAFHRRNAFYDRDLHAVLFGYFDADETDPGSNIPRQRIFTCLSHDIIAHEMTHAIVDRLRPFFLEPTNADTQAFHEGFSDIVALFQHFTFPDLLAREIERNGGDLQQPTVLVELARQFGFARGGGKSLRSALDKPDATLLKATTEAHDRGAILVAAVFDGFFQTYRARVDDLFRIATGGSGSLPPGRLQPYLARRIAAEAARTAQRHLDMCIRAFDYLPPVDITFGDFLRALVTADFELNPDDEWGQRAAVIEGFRRRGIYPEGVTSLAEESLRWPVAPTMPRMQDQLGDLLPLLLRIEADRFSRSSQDAQLSDRSRMSGKETDAKERLIQGDLANALRQYADANRAALCLEPNLAIRVQGFHAVFRTASNGKLLIELVAQVVQTDRTGQVDALLGGGIPVRGGTTILIGVDGLVRYAIPKPLPGMQGTAGEIGKMRLERQAAFVSVLDARDARFPYMAERDQGRRMLDRMSIRSLHEGH